jgi:hypothetical protein
MQVICDRQGDLRGGGPGAGLLIGAAADHLAVQQGQQRRVVRPGFAAYPARLLLGHVRAHAEKPQVEIVRGHLGMHVPDRVEVAGLRGPDLDRGAVGQQRVNAVLRVYAHAALPGPTGLPIRKVSSASPGSRRDCSIRSSRSYSRFPGTVPGLTPAGITEILPDTTGEGGGTCTCRPPARRAEPLAVAAALVTGRRCFAVGAAIRRAAGRCPTGHQ